jgi:hypothetical protein
MVGSFLDLAVRKPRSRSIIRERCGLGDRPPLTLAQTGKQYGLSNERIRQVEQGTLKEMRESPYLRLLAPVAKFVRQQLRRCGGLRDAERLAASLRAHMKWAVQPPGHALTAILGLFQDLSCPRPGEVALEGFPCITCAQAGKTLAKLAGRTGQVTISRAVAEVMKCCRGRCSMHLPPPPVVFSAPLVTYIAETQAGLHSEDGRLYSETQWKLQNLSLTSLAAEILRTSGRPMHFTEIAKEFQRQTGLTVSPHNLHSLVGMNKGLLLWNRGTFVHGDHVAIDRDLLKRVEAWTLRRLSTGIPCLSAFGPFRQFRKECKTAGIDSEIALYSCLKRSGNPRLAFPRCPYIYASGKNVGHILLHRSVEKWLKKAGGVVPQQRVKVLLCEEMGLKDHQANTVLRQLSNVIRTKRRVPA